MHTQKLVLKAVNKSSARSAGNEGHIVWVDVVLGRVVRPLLPGGPLPTLVMVTLTLVRTSLVLRHINTQTTLDTVNRVQHPTKHMMVHCGNQSFQAIDCIGTDNQTHNRLDKKT